jgi:hypothetical protein
LGFQHIRIYMNDSLTIKKMLNIQLSAEERFRGYLKEVSQELKASWYLASVNPRRYYLEKASNMEGMDLQCRLIDIDSNSVLMEWKTYEYCGHNFLQII